VHGVTLLRGNDDLSLASLCVFQESNGCQRLSNSTMVRLVNREVYQLLAITFTAGALEYITSLKGRVSVHDCKVMFQLREELETLILPRLIDFIFEARESSSIPLTTQRITQVWGWTRVESVKALYFTTNSSVK